MTGQAIPQDNRIAHKNMKQSKQSKCCYNLPNNAQILCFNKLTDEHNTKKKILSNFFVLWEYIFKKEHMPSWHVSILRAPDPKKLKFHIHLNKSPKHDNIYKLGLYMLQEHNSLTL